MNSPENRWTRRLMALAEEEGQRGNTHAETHLIKFATGQGPVWVSGASDFVYVLERCGFKRSDVDLNVIAAASEDSKSHEFFMVYREGGRPPAFKHGTEESAFVEANRVARASGEKTYVLAAVKAIDPYQMPTVEQFAKHAEMHGSGNGVGLWRVSGGPRAFPEIVPIRVDRGTAWYASVVNGVSVSRVGDCDGAKWFPLDANGKDLVEDDCPF